MSAAKRVARAAKTIRARWERQVSTDPQTEAAQALEDTGQLLDPEVAAELVAFRKARELAAAVAEHGAFPVPVGPKPQGLTVEREREIRSLDLLALMSDRVAPVVSGHLAVLLDEIDRLREERHTTNEALSDAAEALRADRCPCPPASRPHQVGCPLDGVPASSERPVNGLTAKFMPVPSLREVLDGEHYASVHHDYSKGRDVPGMDGTR